MIATPQHPVRPKDGNTLRVVVVARISTAHQDEQSLEDQQALCKGHITPIFDGPIEWTILASRGSGEILDRQGLTDLEELIESGNVDIVICEDLARICRRSRAYDLCELSKDHNVRLIAINDHVDTATDDWRDSAFISTWHHERSNRDTSQRIKRSLRKRFQDGGVFQCEISGYHKPPNIKSDSDVTRDPTAEPIYDEWFRKLEQGATYADVADWLNEKGVPTGPYCRTKTWSGKMVRRVTFNPILKGVRQRNRKELRRVNKTGWHRSVNASPSALLERHCPHLAFIDAERYDRVIKQLIERNAKYRRAKNGRDGRKNVSRKRTCFPGQMIDCGICGRPYVFGGNGQQGYLMCTGARDHQCWNGITVNGPLAAQKISSAVFAAIESLPDFDPAFLEFVNAEAKRCDTAREQRRRDILRLIDKQQVHIDNLLNFIRGGDTSPSVRDDLSQLEQDQVRTRDEIERLDRESKNAVVVPSINEVREIARESFTDLDITTFEFRNLMGRIIPRIVVFPYRLCDGGHLMLRARFRLLLTGLLPDTRLREVLERPLQQTLTVDLFNPPQREEYRERIVAARQAGKPEREIAAELGITITTTQRAAALQRMMDQREIIDPYLPVATPPDDYKKLRRHKHPRYKLRRPKTGGFRAGQFYATSAGAFSASNSSGER